MIFFWRCHVWKITIFSQPPRWSEKALFCTIFFFSEYRFWSQVGASGVVYLSFLRIYDEKMINFLAQRHIKVFLEFKLFWILNFLVQITPTAIWECILWIPGFNGKIHSYFFAFCHWTLGSMKYTPK